MPAGSLTPASPSSVVPERPPISRRPSTENMTAGSVGASAAPTTPASFQSMPSSQCAAPASTPAVMNVPTSPSDMIGPADARKRRQPMSMPPLNNIDDERDDRDALDRAHRTPRAEPARCPTPPRRRPGRPPAPAPGRARSAASRGSTSENAPRRSGRCVAKSVISDMAIAAPTRLPGSPRRTLPTGLCPIGAVRSVQHRPWAPRRAGAIHARNRGENRGPPVRVS